MLRFLSAGEACDTDGDGSISVEELAAALADEEEVEESAKA